MKLPVEIFGDVAVVHTPEDLGDEQADQLESFLTSLDRVQIILDMDGTESVDSAGLACLLTVQDGLRQHDGNLKISTSNTVNRKILEITRLDQHLEVFESVIDAVKSYA